MINEAGATWHNGTYGLKAGDVLYYDYGYTNTHTTIYVGNGLAVEAKGPSGYSQYDDGGEISVSSNWKWLPWQGYFRIPVK